MNKSTIKDFCLSVWKYLLRHKLHWFALITLLLAFLLHEYESAFLTWYNKTVMPIVSLFHSDIFVWIASLMAIIMISILLCKRFHNEYVYDSRIVFVVLVLCTLIGRCRVLDMYDYVRWLGRFCYVDLCLVLGGAYITMAFVNHIRLEIRSSYAARGNTDNKQQDSLLKDWPIESADQDIFDLKDEAVKIAKSISNLDRKKTWSFAITAPWGTGKTSFMNMVIEQVKTSHKDEFEFVQFNPRDCKSYQSIQEEFFSLMACVLSKYDSRCSSAVKDYMASLQLIDNRGIVEKILNFYKIWDKSELKESIGKSFESLSKRVLVVIDDFDRLQKEEILEVLKLIDSNAAFKNLIFLTAYDKKQVNKALGDAYKTEDACFVDKFFSLEFQIPSRPYTYVSQFIIDNMCEMINADSSEKTLIASVVNNQKRILQDYIPTLRDAKRFVNQVVIDYKQVRGDVLVSEYILIELMKYRYPDSMKKLYKKEYIEKGGFFADGGIYYLKELSDKQIEGIEIIEALFPKKDGQVGQYYHHIYEVQSFDNYFVNQIFASLRTKDMQNLFHKPTDEAYLQLDEWLKKEEEASDVVAYLNSFDMDNFKNGAFFRRYASLIVYVAIKLPQSRAYWLLLRVIYNKNLEGYDKRYGLNLAEYKKSILDVLLDKNIDPLFTMLRAMHMNFVTGELQDSEELIQDGDIKPCLFDAFKGAVNSEIDEKTLKAWLHNCADRMETGSRKIILNEECVKSYRKHLDSKPGWYIKNFVFLGGVSSDPDWNSVACDGFWKQIFGTDAEIEAFIAKCKTENLDGAEVACNFWELYKANDYCQIEFQNQGNVQEKIDGNLETEFTKLNLMRTIGTDVYKVPDSKEGLEPEMVAKHIKTLSDSLKSLDSIKLYIKLNGKLREEIKRKQTLLT